MAQPPPSPQAQAFPLWRALRGSNAFAINTTLNAATNVGQAMIGMATGILAARLLGPRGRGELAAIQTWPTLMGYLCLLGMGDAVIYFSAREPKRAGRYLGSAVLLTVLVCGPLVLLAYLAMPIVLSAQSAAVVRAARWYLFIIPLVALQMLHFCTLRGMGEFNVWNALRVTPNMFWLTILTFAWMMRSSEPAALAAANLAGMSAVLLLIAVVVRRRVSGSFAPEVRNFAPLLRYGMPCVLSTLPQFLNLRLDQMVMTAFLPPITLGLYVAAVAWAGAINPLLTAIAAAQFPEVAAKSHLPDRIRTFVRGTRLAALIGIVTALMLTVATPLAIKLFFGTQFRGAVPSALILVPAGAVAGVNVVMEDGLRGLGHPARVMRAELAGLAVTAACLALFLRPFGILGAAIASFFGYSAVGISLVGAAGRVAGVSAVELLAPRAEDARMLMNRMCALARQGFYIYYRNPG